MIHYSTVRNDSEYKNSNSTYCREIFLSSIRSFLIERKTQHLRTLYAGVGTIEGIKYTNVNLSNIANTINRLYDIKVEFIKNKKEFSANSSYGIFFKYRSPSSADYVTGAQLSSILLLLKVTSLREFLCTTDTSDMDIDVILSMMLNISNNSVAFNQLLSTVLFIRFIDKKDADKTLLTGYINGCHSYMTTMLRRCNKEVLDSYRSYLDMLADLNVSEVKRGGIKGLIGNYSSYMFRSINGYN